MSTLLAGCNRYSFINRQYKISSVNILSRILDSNTEKYIGEAFRGQTRRSRGVKYPELEAQEPSLTQKPSGSMKLFALW